MNFLGGKSQVRHYPKGVVGIISPWNLPFGLTVAPLTSALAAGNRALLKPSEFVPETAALFAEVVPRYFAEEEVAVVTGGADISQQFAELPFDHLLFTGSTRIGAKVMQSASKNLVPVTLELGGKSPVVIGRSAKLELAGTRLTFGKLLNGGQLCLSPAHLFLWDREAECLAGAYRMGLGRDVYEAYGINGFYLQDLFRFEPELHKMMSHSIELGRAFIVKKYQQKPMPLFLLWKGIVHTTLRFPNHKYLIGGVSISNRFSNFSKSLMIEFMKSHYYDPYLAQYVHPKKEFKVKLKDTDKDFVFDATEADLNKFDKIIDEIEPGALRLPVLLKKYIKQNARLIAFNVDPLFNDAIDGLMYIRISDLPDSTVRPVMEEFQAELEGKFDPQAERE